MHRVRNKQSGFSHIIILLAVLVFAGAGYGAWRVYSVKNAQNSAKSSQQADSTNPSALKVGESSDAAQGHKSVIKIPSANGQQSSVTVDPSLFYDVTTANNQRYFGKISKINDEFFKLSDVLYLKNSSLLTRLGSELHGPEPVMYFQTNKVTKLHQLSPAQSEYKTVTEFSAKNPAAAISDASPSSNISDYIKAAQYQAVFFDDGKVYYGKLKNLSGNFLTTSSKVYVLRTNSAAGSPQTDVSLVVATAEEISKYTRNQLLYWENLRTDGQITAAMNQHQQQ